MSMNLIKRLSVGVKEPNLVPIGQDDPEFANPYIFVQGIGRFYLLGEIPLKKARAIRDELQGDLEVAQDTDTLRDRFFDYVDAGAGESCHLWTRHFDGHGYGLVWLDGKYKLAHRVSWEIKNGPRPDGLCVLHTCDRPSCVNPEHLWLGTHKDNAVDRVAKGRQSDTRGEANGNARLTWAHVVEIRESTETTVVLAARFGVSQSHLSSIKRGRAWKSRPTQTPTEEGT